MTCDEPERQTKDGAYMRHINGDERKRKRQTHTVKRRREKTMKAGGGKGQGSLRVEKDIQGQTTVKERKGEAAGGRQKSRDESCQVPSV